DSTKFQAKVNRSSILKSCVSLEPSYENEEDIISVEGRRTIILQEQSDESKGHRTDHLPQPVADVVLQSLEGKLIADSPEHLCASYLSKSPRHSGSLLRLPPLEG